jgi:hypothetical protein
MLTLFLAGQALWLCGLGFLILRVFGRPAFALCFLFVALLPAGYGGFDAFAFGEGFLTPRLFAEAAILFGLGFLFGGRRIVALALLLFAAAWHPLMGLGGLGLYLVRLVLERPRLGFGLLGAGLLATVLGALLGLPYLEGLRAPLDADYLALLRERTSYLFVQLWRAPDLAVLALQFALLALAAKAFAGRPRDFFLTLLLACLAALLVSLIGGDLLERILVIQVQPWRLLWLAQVGSSLALALLLKEGGSTSGRSDAPGQLLLALMLLAVLLSHLGPLASLVALWGVVGLALRGFFTGREGDFKLLVWALPISLAVLLPGAVALDTISFLALKEGDSKALFLRFLPGFLLAFYLLARGASGWPRALPYAAALLLAALSLAAWNRESGKAAYLAREPDLVALNGVTLPAGESVYWPGDPLSVWFGLRRASFYSYEQGAGVAFSETLAEEFQRRRALVAPLGGGFDGAFEAFGETSAVTADRETLLAACRAPGSFDAVVLPEAVEGLAGQPLAILPPAAQGVRRVAAPYHLYRCGELRGAGG